MCERERGREGGGVVEGTGGGKKQERHVHK